ncbi:hypothetical protein [Georgenia satyanarayanai]|uniref:hypothetical protein n=1 Tax=Georgenia satyanarayanai TaxID=860221 RepID=UPI0011B5B9F0|nr:hypothetical protein [Georgenia satyanarayanai]
MAPPTRLGASEEGALVPTEPAPRPTTHAPDEQAAVPRRPAAEPVLPSRSAEDTDAAWGELPERSDDARYLRDKPPHWQ